MRICMISYDFPPSTGGGVEAHVYGLGTALANDGHDVIVMKREERRLRISRERMGKLTVYRISRGPRFTARFWFPLIVGFLSYIQFCRGRGWDIVHWHTVSIDTRAALLSKAKAKIFTNHTSIFVKAASSNDKKNLKIFINAMSLADRVIVPSMELGNLSEKVGISRNKLSYIPNGVDPEYFKPGKNENDIFNWLSEDTVVVLAVRRLEEKNGVEYLVKAWPKVYDACPRAFLMLVGDGSCKRKLQDMAKALGVAASVHFTGSLPPPEVAKYLKSADLVVLPSLIEATSISGLEAMSTGKALVGTCVGGIPEIIEQGNNGLLVPSANAKKLAEAIIELIRDKDLREKMGRAGRRRVENEFSWQIIAERTKQVYQEALRAMK
jgi:glycosyltransferase involved in cell wall biosynthesis